MGSKRALLRLGELARRQRHLSTGSLPRKQAFGEAGSAPGLPKESPYRSLCKLTLIGRTGGPPELHEYDDGRTSLKLNVATKHAAGESVGTQWHTVFVHDGVPGFSFLSELPPGAQVYVEGNMRVATVERDDGLRQFVNVNVSRGHGTLRVLSYPRRSETSQETLQPASKLPF